MQLYLSFLKRDVTVTSLLNAECTFNLEDWESLDIFRLSNDNSSKYDY